MQSKFSFSYFGSKIDVMSLGTDFLPSIEQTLTAHCMPFTKDGEIIAINIVGRGIDIPGGHIDEGETAVEAMQREAVEEAQIVVEDPILIDIWQLSSTDITLGLSEKPYLLLYATKVKSMLEFKPNEESNQRLLLSKDEFIARYFAGEIQAEYLIDKAMLALR